MADGNITESIKAELGRIHDSLKEHGDKALAGWKARPTRRRDGFIQRRRCRQA